MATLSFDPKAKKVERDEETFLRLIGECVTQWAFLDRELFRLTQTALGTDEIRTAIVFYIRPNIADHLKLVGRLMKHGLSDTYFKNKWRPLNTLIVRHLDTRSIYAHQPIKRSGKGQSNRAFYYYSIYIEPAEQLIRKGPHQGLGGKSELLAKDLRKHAHSLQKLVKEVADFRAFFKQHTKFSS